MTHQLGIQSNWKHCCGKSANRWQRLAFSAGKSIVNDFEMDQAVQSLHRRFHKYAA